MRDAEKWFSAFCWGMVAGVLLTAWLFGAAGV